FLPLTKSRSFLISAVSLSNLLFILFPSWSTLDPPFVAMRLLSAFNTPSTIAPRALCLCDFGGDLGGSLCVDRPIVLAHVTAPYPCPCCSAASVVANWYTLRVISTQRVVL